MGREEVTHGRILVVDDDVTLRMLLRKALNKSGCHVEVADSGKTGLEMLKVESFDLVVLDINMPSMSGHELAEQIEKLYPNLPVVFMTAEPDAQNVKRAYAKGAKDFLVKPFDDINQVVNKILEAIEVARAQASAGEALETARKTLSDRRDEPS
jgi:CheY-like chemotaxis protein